MSKKILDIVLDSTLTRNTSYVPKGSKFGPQTSHSPEILDKHNYGIGQIVMAFDSDDQKWKMGSITGINEFQKESLSNIYRVALSKFHNFKILFTTKVEIPPSKIIEN